MLRSANCCTSLALLVLVGCGGSGGGGLTVEDRLTVEGGVSTEIGVGNEVASEMANGVANDLVNDLAIDLANDFASELDGQWVSSACIVDQGQSLSENIAFNGNTMTRSLIRHTASTDCSDRFTISLNFVADIEVTGETFLSGTAATNATREIAITYTRGYVTASGATQAELRARGTLLEDILLEQGITELENIPITIFIDHEVVHSTYLVDADVLHLASTSLESASGTPLNPNPFANTEFTRVAVEPGCAAFGSANRTVSVLLVGNSLMNGVQPNLERLLACGGYTSDMATSNPGGYFLYQHNENPRTENLIAQGFDLTLIQEQSRSIATHTPPYDIINALKGKIEASGSEMGFYQTWGYQNREVALTDEILFGYENLAAEFNAPIAHIGRAWDYFYTSNNESPPFSLYRDYAHSTPQGKALIAFVLYAYLTGESPVNLSSLSLADEEALELQEIAWLTYQSSL